MDNITSLQLTDGKVGTGVAATSGKQVSVHYTGWLYDAKAADKHGKKFDSSRDHGDAFTFKLGAGQVIAGDRKSTRLNSSHGYISYAVFCLKKKKKQRKQ